MVSSFNRPRSRIGLSLQNGKENRGRGREPAYAQKLRRGKRGRLQSRQSAALTTELLVAMALLITALLPFAYSFAAEKRLARSYYQRAVATEIVDGEMEVLVAGEWRSFKSGWQDYSVHAAAVTNLPPGKFKLEVRPIELGLVIAAAIEAVRPAIEAKGIQLGLALEPAQKALAIFN